MVRIWLQRDAEKWNYYAYCLKGRFWFRDQHAVYHQNDGSQDVGTRDDQSWGDISGFLVSDKVHRLLCRFTFITAIRIHKLWLSAGKTCYLLWWPHLVITLQTTAKDWPRRSLIIFPFNDSRLCTSHIIYSIIFFLLRKINAIKYPCS